MLCYVKTMEDINDSNNLFLPFITLFTNGFDLFTNIVVNSKPIEIQMSGYHRDVGPVIQAFRAFLRGRGWNDQLRYQEQLSPRPYPKPLLPDGVSNQTSLNYYYSRDGRRLFEPPKPLIDNIPKQLTSGETPQLSTKSVPKPGITHNWD